MSILNEYGISNDDVGVFKNDNSGFVGVNKNRISSLLYAQLASASKYRLINTFSVTDVIQGLEKVGRVRFTKKESQFKHPPLKGLWKAHYFDASFILKNISIEWIKLERKNSKPIKQLDTMINNRSNFTPKSFAAHSADNIVIKGYNNRVNKKKITGEWLIYGKHKEKNYYLCIAQHSKPGSDDDSQIYNFLRTVCGEEFPFLFT